MASNETRRMVLAAASACEEKKGEETRILELDPADSGFTDFFLVTSGANERQTQAIAEEIESCLERDFHTRPNSVEGLRRGEWVLMDYVDFVVHIFLAEKRAFYDIERLRKSARGVGLAELRTALKEKTAAAREKKSRARAPAPQKAERPVRTSAAKPAVKKTTRSQSGQASESRSERAATRAKTSGKTPAKNSAVKTRSRTTAKRSARSAPEA